MAEKNPHAVALGRKGGKARGREEDARRDLYYLTQNYVPQYDWEKELQSRSEVILRALDSGLEKAQALLREWARETVHKLGLPTEL